jgi:hypothetical protein
LDTPALAEGAGLWGDVPWLLATGNERLTGLLVGNRIDHLWVCGGKWESYGGGERGGDDSSSFGEGATTLVVYMCKKV